MSVPTKPVAPWEDVVLRVIAIYKIVKSILAFALGITLLHLVHHDISAFLRDNIITPLHFADPDDSENQFVSWLIHDLDWLSQEASYLTPHKIRFSAYTSFFYGTVFAIEGTGLYLKKHWAEYMVLVVTGSFLPFEIYLLFSKLVWWKLVLIAGNLLIIVYLVHRLMLDYQLRKAAQAQAEAAAEKPQDRSAISSKPVPTEVP